ncbi:MAG TPA: O-antigen ligase family protein [Thermoanaerobaculia bacterium]
MKSARSSPRRPSAAAAPDSRPGTFLLWLLVLVPPFLWATVAKESFREPKLLASEWLALASLLALVWELRRVEEIRWADVWRLSGLRLALPALLVATAGLAFTHHSIHAREGLIDLWIGAVALIGWSVAVPGPRLERLLHGLLWPATALAAIAILQFHDLWQPLRFLRLAPASRLAVTSLAGNPGDLGAYLVLPALVAQESLWRRLRDGGGWRRPAVWGTAGALAICVYALLLTQTLAAVAALLAGTLLLWGSRLPRRRVVPVLAGGALAAALLVAVVPPLRHRVTEKVRAAAGGDWNSVLTGRLDGWRTAVWMLEEHPLAGVGQGAYRPEFVPAKLALLERGVQFFPEQTTVVFANAHNEYLEAAADWGIPGLLALAWGLWVLLTALRRVDAEERSLAWAGTAALAVLALVYFPFRVALVAYPALLFLSWVLRGSVGEAPRPETGIPGRTLAAFLALVLAAALVGQTMRWHDRATGSRLLRRVELLSLAAASAGQAPPALLAANLDDLRRAAPLDPVEVGIPIARGTQYYLLGRPEAAERSYEEALRLEPRPEGYLNLGRAQWQGGRKEEAMRSFGVAVQLDPLLARELPPGAR